MPAAVHGAPTVMDGLVYVATCGRCGQHGVRSAKAGPVRDVRARTRAPGKLVWTFADGHYSPLVADEERVYLVGSTRIYGIRARARALDR